MHFQDAISESPFTGGSVEIMDAETHNNLFIKIYFERYAIHFK